jgi:hypothetical protein
MEAPSGLKVVVLGPPTAVLVGALWAAGLRPVRGQVVGSVWARPEREGRL